MEGLRAANAEGPARRHPWLSRWWIPVLLALTAWQGWMTYTLFGADPTWRIFCDERPILSGRHPLHLYHGYLGAQSLRERGMLSCYDPAFQAGYPKTPVFDSGSRPAELFLSLARGECQPGAYKIGLAICCLCVPIVLAVAARGAGLGSGETCVAVALGLLVWWGSPCRDLLEVGDLDLLLAGLAALAQAGLLLRFHAAPGLLGWWGLYLVTAIGWFAHPLFLASLLPLVLLYYLTVGTRHGPAWHLSLLLALAGAVGTNAFWLSEWLSHCWICQPLQASTGLLSHRTIANLWSAPLWGDQIERAVGVSILALALVGSAIWNERGLRVNARLLGLGAIGFAALAIAGAGNEPLARLGTTRLLVPALWFGIPPAIHGCACITSRLGCWLGTPRFGVLWPVAGAVVAAALTWPAAQTLLPRLLATTPLTIGLDEQQDEIIATLVTQTTSEARILWEDHNVQALPSRWTALLPLWTGRSFVGGLDPEATIEHGYARFANQLLLGRPIRDWSDDELAEFCRRYNIGWVACWSPAALDRFHGWTSAEPVAALPGEPSGCLFQVPLRSFVLKGQARLVRADAQRITLADVVPEDGKVILSMHYQAGLQASPSRVQIEREPDPRDPIPFIRLLVPGPVARITLTWE